MTDKRQTRYTYENLEELDGKTIAEAIAHLQERAAIVGSSAVIEIASDYDSDYVNYSLQIARLETDDEMKSRLEQQAYYEIQRRQSRLRQYLELQKEFME